MVTKLLATAFAVAGLAFAGTQADACDKSHPTGFAVNLTKTNTPVSSSDYVSSSNVLKSATGGLVLNGQNYQWSWTNPDSEKASLTNISSFSADQSIGGSNAYFYNNSANFGGAISKTDTVTVASIAADFINNNANGQGGAIYQDHGTISSLTGNFLDNKADGLGGAIYNAGTITINTADNDIYFIGNTAGGVANDIYNTGTINLNAGAGKTIYLTGGVNGDYGTVNLTGAGTVDISTIKKQTVNVQSGELHLSAGSADGSNLSYSTVSVASGALINTIDGEINNYGNKIVLAAGANLKTDIALATGTHDTFTANGAFNLTGFGVTSDSELGATTEIQLSDKAITVADNIKVITSIQEYSVTSTDTAGKIKVTGSGAATGGINTAVNGTTSEGGKSTVAYTLTADSEDFTGGTIKNSDFSITGNGKDGRVLNLTDNNMVVNSDATLALKDIKLAGNKIIENNNGATLTIKDSAIGVTIHNKGILNSDPTTYTVHQINEETATYNGDTFALTSPYTGGEDAKALGGALYNTGSVTLTNTNFTDNIVQSANTGTKQPAQGGAIYSTKGISITGGTFSGNQAYSRSVSATATASPLSYGGAINITAADNSETSTISGATFSNNATYYDKYASGALTKTIIGSGGAIYNKNATLNIENTSFTGNKSLNGGAIYSDSANVKIDGGSFTLNEANGNGGAISAAAGTNIEINDSTFTGNIANNSGGAIYVKATNSNKATLNINDSTISSNTVNDVYGGGGMYIEATNATLDGTDVTSNTALKAGGGIYNKSYSALVVKGDSHIDNNTANTSGGGIHNQGADTNSVTITASSVSGNTSNNSATGTTFSKSSGGGGIYSSHGTLLVQNGSKINDNTAKYSRGGGIETHATATINASEVKGNRAVQGAGIYNQGTLTVTNGSTISENIATAVDDTESLGGGIYNSKSLTVSDNSLIDSNRADFGGGIYTNSEEITVSISDSIISNNIANKSGGGLYNQGKGTVSLSNTSFTGNSALSGGALSVQRNANTYKMDGENNYLDENDNITTDPTKYVVIGVVKSGTTSITGSTFTKNIATTGIGGAILASYTENLVIEGTSFGDGTNENANTSVVSGGAIGSNNVTNFSIKGSTFNLNKTTGDDSWGGAIYAVNSSLTIDKDANDNKVYFTNNSADWGGAVAVSGADTELSVKNAEFELNSADVAGGAISIANNIKSAIIDSVKFGDTSKGNTAAGAGGAVWFGIDGAITNSTFIANSSTSATTDSDGGGALFVGGASDLVVIGSKFDSNVSASRGGAIATRPVGSSGSSSLYITGDGTSATEFNGNSAVNGGAIWTEVKTVIANTNFTNNIATSGNGGAISHTATDANRALGIIADGKDVTFSGNKANNVNNDIYNSGQLELIATGANKITLGGGITGSNGTVNINDLSTINSYKVLNGTTIENKPITAAAGEVVFGGNVSDQTINVKAGKLTNNATLTALGGSNSGTIDGTGDFVLNKSGSTFTNSGSFTQKSLTVTSGNFTTDADNLHLTNDIKNDGTLTINAGGTIANNIIKDTAGSGIVDIAAGSGNTVDITAGKTITDNIIKLTSGTFKIGSDDGTVNLTGATKIVAGDGTLDVQDSKTGNISLGVVDTATNAKALNVNIDVNLGDSLNVAKADVLSVTTTGSDLTNKINLSSIKWVNSTTGDETEDDILIANDTLGDAITLAMSEIDTKDGSGEPTGVGNLLVSKNYVSGVGTYLHTKHTDLKNAIVSTVDDKAYVMGANSTIDGLKLGGSSLSVTTKGYDITSTSNNKSTDGITFDSTTGANQSINIIGTADSPDTTNTVISGFKTAINNTVGGTVRLKDVTMTGNTVDVVNTGEGTKGLFITGTSTLDKVYDSATGATGAKGQTTIGNGDATTDTVTIGEIIQKNVNVLSDGALNISADKLTTTEGTDNAGTLNLSGTSGTATPSALASAIGNAAGTTNITGNIATNGHNITQNNLNVGTTAGKGNLTNNNTINANNIIVTTESILENNSTIAAANGTDKALITANAGSEINLNTGSNAKADLTLKGTDASKSMLTITDNGKLDGNVISDNGATIELIADTQDITMSNAITGAISGSTAGNNGVYALVAHSVPNTSTTPATVHSVTIDKEIAGATSISVLEDTKATITNVAIGSNTTTPINVSNNAELTLKNTTAGTMNVENAITKAGTTDKYDVIVNNTNAAGITNINNTIIGAETVTGDGGTTNLKSIITGADKVIAKAGTTNIDAGTNSNTSSRIGLADIEVKNNAIAGVKTTSDSFVLDSDVTGQSAAATLQLNGKSGTPESPTNVGTQFTIASTINHGTVELANGQLNLPTESILTNADGLRIDGGATLNTMNGSTSEFNKPTEFKDGAQLKIDANVFTKATDKFINPTELGNEKLTDLSIQGLDKIYNTRSVNLTSGTGLNNLQAGAGLADLISSRYPYVVTPVRLLKGQVQQTDEGLMLQFVPTAEGYEGFNSAVLAAPIAAQMGGYLTQLHSYDEAFRNMDMYMLMTKEERQAMKMRNKFATASKDLIYDPTVNQYENKAGWFRPYATFENVGLDNGPRVSNVAYGTYVGGDSEMYDLGHGWDGMWGAYVGYNGSHQAYGNHNSIYQNGGTLGVVGMAYKGDFFTGLTINAGANGAEASTMYGSENFAMLMAGIASKTGYNWELANGKFIIQPSALVSYSFVNTFDYRNAAGIDISNDPLHAIQIEPGIKFIGNLKNGWQPYASVSMVWNIMDKTHFHANEVALPDMSVKPFVKYGVGVRKSWGERFTAFFQTYFTNGGRNGVGLQAGFRWTLGGNKSSVKTSNNTQVKKEIKSK